MKILGIDVGGSEIKAGIVDTLSWNLISDQILVPTPPRFTQDEILGLIVSIAGKLDHNGPIGIGFPSSVIDGVIQTPPTTFDHAGWIDYSLTNAVQDLTGFPVAVVNDADAAGIAEVRFGAGRNVGGLVMVFTLGTGIGSAIFMNGQLIPNTLLGHIFLSNSSATAEKTAAARAISVENLSWEIWGERLNKYLNHIEHVFSPDLVIVGGAVSNDFELYKSFISTQKVSVIPGELREKAGIIGAACVVSLSLEKDIKLTDYPGKVNVTED